MKQRRNVSIVMAMWLASAAGCSTPPPTASSGDVAHALIVCEEPRPEICTMHYDPVCGALEGGSTKTYSNACAACSDRAVTGYTENPCAPEGSHNAPRE